MQISDPSKLPRVLLSSGPPVEVAIGVAINLKKKLDKGSASGWFQLTDDFIVLMQHVVGIDTTGLTRPDKGAGFIVIE